MMENGPCKLSASINKTENNPFSWNNIANVVYLDQPLGAGYSYGSGGALTSDQVGDTVHAFLQLFFQRFPKYKNSDFHVMGESYAGHYIPAIGKVINDRNKNPYSTKINLKSIAIGNGITNPLVQRQYRGLMYCNNSYFPISSKPDCDAAIKAWPECQSKLQECLNGNTDICDSINKYCAKAIPDILSNLNLNSYDIRRNCDPDSGGLCYSIINNIEYYFNQNIIKQALGANIDLEYQICNSTLNGQFGNSNNDRSVNFAPYVANLLNDGIRALIYAGDADIVCDWMGNKAWTKALNWTGNFGFNSAPDSLWKPDPISQPLGESCTYKNFSFLRIFGAGHMVPMDQPFSALHMVSTWIKGSSF
jgi:cathepsin A (carboxypeptidase C)